VEEVAAAALAAQQPADNIADGVARPLDPRYVELQREVSWITTGVLAFLVILGSIGLLASDLPLLVRGSIVAAALILVGLAAWWGQRWPAIEFRFASYRVDAEGLEFTRGVYFRAVTNVPRTRIQHTDVSQGPLQRRHGLATLVVHTAGSESAEVQLPGLPHDRALLIRDHLLPVDRSDAV
jgi:membrane protein YdbS with pleckstrin-like domain